MKHKITKYMTACVFLIIALFAYINISVQEAYAFGTSTPFGGLITITTVPGVTCTGGSGPVTIMPAGGSTASPYLFPYGTQSAPSEGQWVLGNYDSVMDISSCQTDTTPPVPYPVYKVTLFSSSN